MMEDQNLSELNNVWNEMGLSEESIGEEITELNRLIFDAQSNFLRDAKNTRTNMIEEIKSTRGKLSHYLSVLGGSQPEIEAAGKIGLEGPLRVRLDSVKAALSPVSNRMQSLISEFSALRGQILELFDNLGIPSEEREDFAKEVGEDFSEERKNILTSKIDSLKEELEARKTEISSVEAELKKNLATLKEEMDPEIAKIINGTVFSEGNIDKVTQYSKEVSDLRAARIADLSEVALAITNLWDLLEIPKDETQNLLSTHSDLSVESIEDCKKELLRLEKMKGERLPQLIDRMKAEIRETASKLRKSEGEIQEIVGGTEIDKESFDRLEEAVMKLRSVYVSALPILQAIDLRESIISEYSAAVESEQSSKKSGGEAKSSMAIEKAKRRYKVVLPRHEKKLLISLLEYRTAHCEDFIYDGEPYSNRLQHIKLSEAELSQARNVGKKKTVRKSLAQPEKQHSSGARQRKSAL